MKTGNRARRLTLLSLVLLFAMLTMTACGFHGFLTDVSLLLSSDYRYDTADLSQFFAGDGDTQDAP